MNVFNILGQKANTLYDADHQAGYMTVIWNGMDDSGNEVASGLYFYRVSTDSERITRRMLMLK
ncbi:MAG: hypothetical protein GY839_22045 [candidate division Zixibacteria bacterium]|nr:hypothetical protein [candidate division Zixibacteria bacterium]